MKVKHKMQKWLAAFVVVLMVAVVAMVPMQVQAAQTPGSDIGFYVRAVLPQNQQDASVTYFDLLMQPGQNQELEIEIVNETNEDITVSLQAISASTNSNGVIDYKTPGVRDVTLRIPFSDIATLREPSVVVKANGTARASFGIQMPAEGYDGVVLGGIVLTKEGQLPTEHSGEGAGAVIQNIYSYVIGVKLTETDVEVLPDFELFDVKAQSVDYQPTLVHYIRNKEAAIVKGMTVDVTVYKEGTNEAIAHIVRKDVDMAPNSVMELGATLLADENGTIPPLGPGNYTSNVTLEHGGESWSFEHSFVVGGPQADEINDGTIANRPASVPVWLILGILFGVIVILLLIIIILLLKRRKDKDEERKRPVHVYSKHRK